MKYLKQFETQVAYDAAKSGLVLPNVSLINADGHVEYEPYVAPDPYNGHAYVDLGLPSGTKWGTMNVGASSETDYGNFYQYGKGLDTYETTSGQSRYSGTESPLALSADTAALAWGGEWHIPTKAQFDELTANTTYEWVTDFNGSGINGGKFTSQNDNFIFLPAGGFYNNIGSHFRINDRGCYLSSVNMGKYDQYLDFWEGYRATGRYTEGWGFNVRPVVG